MDGDLNVMGVLKELMADSVFAEPASGVSVVSHGTTTRPEHATSPGPAKGVAGKEDCIPAAKAGMLPDVKNLYQGKPDSRGQSTWVDKYPDDLEEAAENAETARYAFLIRNRKCYDGRKKLQIDSIVIQSPLLKNALGVILKDYPGVTASLDRLTFKPPFMPFVHRWSRLVDAVGNEEDPDTKSHLELLYKILEGELSDQIKMRDDYIRNGVITYHACWMLFEPGMSVFTIFNGDKRALKLIEGDYQTRAENFYVLKCQAIDWDGEKFGWDSTKIRIGEFSGTAEITKLLAFPLEYHPAVETVTEDLTRRGKIFETLRGYHYKSYQGVAVEEGQWGPVRYNVSLFLFYV